MGPRIIQYVGEDVRCVGGLRILSDAWPLPFDLNGHSAYRRFNDYAFTVLYRWNWRNRISDEWIRTPTPASKLPLSQGEDSCWIDVSSDNKRRIIRDVVFRLNRPHFLGRGRRNYLPVTNNIFSAVVPRIQFQVHLPLQAEERARLVSVVFSNNYLPLTLELVSPKKWRSYRSCHELDCIAELLRRHGHVVIDNLLAGRCVEDRSELRGLVPKLVGLRVLLIRPEEHVLVHVCQTLILRRLGE